jgi:hypothetical protein
VLLYDYTDRPIGFLRLALKNVEQFSEDYNMLPPCLEIKVGLTY